MAKSISDVRSLQSGFVLVKQSNDTSVKKTSNWHDLLYVMFELKYICQSFAACLCVL